MIDKTSYLLGWKNCLESLEEFEIPVMWDNQEQDLAEQVLEDMEDMDD